MTGRWKKSLFATVFSLLLIQPSKADFASQNPGAFLSYFNDGIDDLDKKDYDHAISNFTKAILINPRSANPYRERGLAYYAKRDFDRVIEDATKAIKLNPLDRNGYHLRAIAHSAKSDHDKAIIDQTEAIKIEPTSPELYRHRGVFYRKNGDYEKAIADFTKAIEIMPELTFYIERGRAYQEQGNYEQAIMDFTKAMEINPIDVDAYYYLSIVYFEKGDDIKFEDNFLIVIQLEVGSANRYKDLANAYSSKKEHDRAIAVYTKAIQFQKMNPKLYDGRGLVYSTAGKYKLAKKDYDMADALRKYGIGR